MWKSYIKVFILSCIATTLIAGLISFLSHIDEIYVAPDINLKIWRSRQGIVCWPKMSSGGMYNIKKRNYCSETVVDFMANNTEQNSDWQCDVRTDLSNKSIYSLWPSAQGLVYSLYTFAVIYGIALFLHDYKLLKMAKNNENVQDYSFYPSTTEEIYKISLTLRVMTLYEKYNDILEERCYLKKWLDYLMYIILLALCGIDLIIFFVYCIRYPIHSSAILVGVSRLIILMVSTTISYWLCFGCIIQIPPSDDDCTCYCTYTLKQKDLFSLFTTFNTLAVVGSLFLYSWMKEGYHQHHFLYVVKYSLPMTFAVHKNPGNPAGGLLEKVAIGNTNADDSLNQDKRIMAISLDEAKREDGDDEFYGQSVNNDESKDYVLLNEDDGKMQANALQLEIQTQDKNDDEELDANFSLRAIIFGAWMISYWALVTGTWIFLPAYNLYQLPQWLCIIFYITAGLFYVGIYCVCVCLMCVGVLTDDK